MQEDKITLSQGYTKQLITSFVMMIFLLFVSLVFFEELIISGSVLLRVLSNFLVIGAIFSFFQILFFEPVKFVFDHEKLKIVYLWRVKKYDWIGLNKVYLFENQKSIQLPSGASARRYLCAQFRFNKHNVELLPKHIDPKAAQKTENKKLVLRNFISQLIEYNYLNKEIIEDSLD